MQSKVTIYIGSPIEYDSEKFAFQAILDRLNSMNTEALLIANVNLNKTQVDFIVAFEMTSYVIEVKGTRQEIKGGVNGTWSQKTSATAWTPIRNYYEQAMKAGYVVRDELSQFLGRQVPYTHTQLLFAPGLNTVSRIPATDFKVTTISIAGLPAYNNTAKQNGCTIQEWKSFLATHHIHPVTTPEAALSAQLYQHEQLLKNCNRSLIETWKDDIKTFVPVACTYTDNAISLSGIMEMATANKNLLIAGPSGCSKTLMAKWLATQLAAQDHVTLYLEAKYFNSLLGPLLDEEIKLLGAPSAAVFFDACKKLEKTIIIVVDGYNESSRDKQKRIDRCLLALCIRYSASTIIVSQDHQAGSSALNLELITVPMPDLETKKQIAASYSSPEASKKLQSLLSTATSGLEAMMIGNMAVHKLAGKSRFSLFDYYVRQKLDAAATEGTRTLSRIAQYLADRVSFVLSIRELEELDIEPGIVELLIGKKLLARYFDKLSFGHELFLHAYTADDIIRRAGHDPEILTTALGMPINRNSRMFLLGAIEDEAVLLKVLEKISDSQLIAEIYLGEGGEVARQWAVTRFTDIFKKLKCEVQQLQFVINYEGFRKVSMVEESMNKWSPPEMAFIYAIPELLLHGHFFEEVFQVARFADATLDKEFTRLYPEAKEKKIAIRSDLFSAAYCPFSDRGSGLSRIVSTLNSGLVSLRMQNEAVPANVATVINLESWSNGTLYTALTLGRFNDGLIPLYSIIYHCLTEKWKFLPYHLKIELLEGAGYFWPKEEERLLLIDAIKELIDNSNPMMNTNIFDTLGRLGAFENEEEEERKNVDHRLQRILVDKENPENWSEAVGIFYAHFDHPYSGAYGNAIYELPEAERKEFMIMVVRGIDDGMFTTSAIVSLAKFDDPAVAVYLQRFISEPPKEKSSMPQDDLAVYILAHCILAQFGALIDTGVGKYSTTRDNALSAVAIVHYWINRTDLTNAEIKAKCEEAWLYLEKDAANYTMDILYQSFAALRNHDIGYNLKMTPAMIHEVFPERVAAVCRHAIRNGSDLCPLYQWDKKEAVLTHAITFLEVVGSSLDIPLLKQLADHSEFGHSAISAVKKLQEKALA
ncbi:NERD domain-containing protein [Terrimonas ferruginea]|uniref:NERD domain-containing protein n=1 Tax=Terrimonas ferruginea TaxID=249 RepID=UPI0009DB9AE5|nr:NERD domain-containing protein [Terrimonas ferruginea]